MRHLLDCAGLSCSAVGDLSAAKVRQIRREDDVLVVATALGAPTELAKRAHRGELEIIQSSQVGGQLRFLLKKP